MRSKLTALAIAVAVMAALGAASVAAADASSDTDGVLPDDYEVDVVDHDDTLRHADVEDALAITWENDEVRDAVDDESSVEFTVWARGNPIHGSDVTVWVSDATESAHATVIAEVDLDEKSVVAVREPIVVESADLEAVDVADSEDDDDGTFTLEVEAGDDAASDDDDREENATRLTADESFRIDLSEHDVEPRDDGTIELELAGDE